MHRKWSIAMLGDGVGVRRCSADGAAAARENRPSAGGPRDGGEHLHSSKWFAEYISHHSEPVRIVVLEGDTGTVASQVPLKSKVTSYRLVRKGNVIYGLHGVMTAKLALE